MNNLLILFKDITGKTTITGNKVKNYNSREEKIDSRIVKQYNREM